MDKFWKIAAVVVVVVSGQEHRPLVLSGQISGSHKGSLGSFGPVVGLVMGTFGESSEKLYSLVKFMAEVLFVYP